MSRGPILQCGFTKFSLGPNIRSISKKDAFLFFFFCISPPSLHALIRVRVHRGWKWQENASHPLQLASHPLHTHWLRAHILPFGQIHFASKANTFYSLDRKWQDGTARLTPCIASCKLHLLPSEPHWSPQTLSSCSYCALWTNTFCSEDRYILKPGQIYYTIWTNTHCISSPPHWSPQTLASCSLFSVIVTTKQCQCLYYLRIVFWMTKSFPRT